MNVLGSHSLAKSSAKVLLLAAALALWAVPGCGEIRNPLGKEKPFVSTPYPADFAVVIDESDDTYYARQHIRQVVTASDLMSRTYYTTYRDYNNTVAREFSNEFPVNAQQMQAMWDQVSRYNLLQGAQTWYYWQSFTDDYKRTERVMQIRANGKVQTYRQLNHWGYKLRDLALLVEAARLPSAKVAPTVPATPGAMPATPARQPAPKAQPITTPGTRPVSTAPSTEPELPNITPETK